MCTCQLSILLLCTIHLYTIKLINICLITNIYNNSFVKTRFKHQSHKRKSGEEANVFRPQQFK